MRLGVIDRVQAAEGDSGVACRNGERTGCRPAVIGIGQRGYNGIRACRGGCGAGSVVGKGYAEPCRAGGGGDRVRLAVVGCAFASKRHGRGGSSDNQRAAY